MWHNFQNNVKKKDYNVHFDYGYKLYVKKEVVLNITLKSIWFYYNCSETQRNLLKE